MYFYLADIYITSFIISNRVSTQRIISLEKIHQAIEHNLTAKLDYENKGKHAVIENYLHSGLGRSGHSSNSAITPVDKRRQIKSFTELSF